MCDEKDGKKIYKAYLDVSEKAGIGFHRSSNPNFVSLLREYEDGVINLDAFGYGMYVP